MYRRQFLALSVSALAATRARAYGAMFYNNGGLALDGFDTVSFFRDGGPLRGRRDIAVHWKGAVWRFADSGNRDRFESDPWHFAPRYGAYCAYSVALGQLTASDPRAWWIDDDRLYVMANRSVRDLWLEDTAANIARADANWPAVLLDN